VTRVDPETFGRNLKAAVEGRKRTRGSLVGVVKRDKTSISKYLTGRSRPRAEVEERLLKELAIDSFDLPSDKFNARYNFGEFSEHPDIKKLRYDNGEFKEAVLHHAREARESVHYASLCRAFPYTGRYTPVELGNAGFVARLKKQEISFRMVQVFFEDDDLVNAMVDVARFPVASFACEYYPTPERSVPAISFRSYDNNRFIIGGFHDRAGSGSPEYALLFDAREPVRTFLSQYWTVLWEQGIAFPRPDRWTENNPIYKQLGWEQERWLSAIAKAKSKLARAR
jgi:transcriptional regulator with XRE-family HTH domain